MTTRPFYMQIARRYQQVGYDQFVQRVRRHRPSDLLPALARAAVQMADREHWMQEQGRVMTPWSLALAAKESIVSGNEHRQAGVTDRDLVEICHAVAVVRDPLGDGSAAGGLAPFMTRLSHEQFPFQVSPFEEVARTQALYVDALLEAKTHRLTSGILASAIGSDLATFAGVGFLLAAGATANDGYFDLRWLEQPNFTEILEVIPAEAILDVFHGHFATTQEEVRSAVMRNRPPGDLRRHEFNPLRGKPFIATGDGRWLAPQPAYAFHKLEPNAIYYAAAPRLGADFTNDLGRLFETHVGRNLDLLKDGRVVREIVFDDDKRSTDFFVVFDAAVVLVEAKTTRLTASARLGTATLAEDLDRTIGEAFGQIEASAQLVRRGHAAFASIPTDRPMLGMVVTLEPYWMANSEVTRALMTTAPPSIPTVVASSRELERWTADHLEGGGGDALLSILNHADRSTWNLELALPRRGDSARPRNPILEAAWAHLPWGDTVEELSDGLTAW